MTAPPAVLAGHASPTAGATPHRLALHTATGRRAALGLLLTMSGVLYSVGLAASGWANSYYSAAAQAGSQSWSAFLFGGLDPVGGITVDKPPAALWPMDLSVRLFGLSTASLLLPQALGTVAAVGLLYGTVRRQALTVFLGRLPAPTSPVRGPVHAAGRAPAQTREAWAVATGLLAGAVFAVTPVVTLLARYDNPDAAMVLLSVAAAYALTRAVERRTGGAGWLSLAGALLGLGFLTKLLQAWLVVPAFVAVALAAGAGTVGRRLIRIGGAGAAMLAAAGWWVLVVEQTPPGSRPWIGGTRTDSILDLALGYDGFGRVTGQEGGGGAADLVRPGSPFRLLGSWAPEGGWLLPAALVGLVAGWVLTRGRPRRDPLRAGLVLWGGWLLGCGVVLSSLRGISHSYYAVQLAPAVAGATALGGALLWARARQPGAHRARLLVAGTAAVTAAWSTGQLLTRPAWPLVAAPVAIVAAGLVVRALRPGPEDAGWGRRTAAAVLVALLAGPIAWSLATAQAVHRGANVYAGPGASSVPLPAGVAPGLTVHLPVALVDQVRAGAAGYDWAAAVLGRRAADLQLASGVPVWALGGFSGNDPHPSLDEFRTAVADGRVHYLVLEGPGAAGSDAGQIARWARLAFPTSDVGGWQVVDLGAGAR